VRGDGVTTGSNPFFRRRQAEILVGAAGRNAATRCAIEKACLNQERLVDILNRVLVFVDSGGQAVHANRTAVELLDDGPQQVAIDFVETPERQPREA
jgi:hypothetical protein